MTEAKSHPGIRKSRTGPHFVWCTGMRATTRNQRDWHMCMLAKDHDGNHRCPCGAEWSRRGFGTPPEKPRPLPGLSLVSTTGNRQS